LNIVRVIVEIIATERINLNVPRPVSIVVYFQTSGSHGEYSYDVEEVQLAHAIKVKLSEGMYVPLGRI